MEASNYVKAVKIAADYEDRILKLVANKKRYLDRKTVKDTVRTYRTLIESRASEETLEIYKAEMMSVLSKNAYAADVRGMAKLVMEYTKAIRNVMAEEKKIRK